MFGTIHPKPAGNLRLLMVPSRAASRRGTARWIVVGAQAVVRFAVERWRLRQAERHLRELDDRLLKDIGIDRGEIDRVVWRGRSRS